MKAFPTIPNGHVTTITPLEFELLVKSFLIESGQGLKNLDVQHNVKQIAYDGTYQIDVKATFEAFGGGLITVLVECKNYNTPVKREKVEILRQRLQALGANKGILCATSGFQQGAIDFAKEHGIALIWVVEKRFTYLTLASGMGRHVESDWPEMSGYVGFYSYNYNEKGHSIAFLQEKSVEPLKDFINSSS